MEEITPDNLRAKVEELSRDYNFPIHNLFVGKDDYSKPEVEKLGLSKRNEILIGCLFEDEAKTRKVRMEHRLFNGEFDSFFALIYDDYFEIYPEIKEIIGDGLSEAGIVIQPQGRNIYAPRLANSIHSVETFLSTYFKAQQQRLEYIRKRRELDAQHSKGLAKLLHESTV